MFVDASAIVAVLSREPDSEEIVRQLTEIGGNFFVSPLVRLEVVLALSRNKAGGSQTDPRSRASMEDAERIFDKFIDRINAEEISISNKIGRAAVSACAAYGKVCGHPAMLNFGDCFAYACAKTLEVGLLYKGDDFARTDLAGPT